MFSKNQKLKTWAKRIAYGFFITFAVLLCFYGSIYFGFWGEIPSAKKLANLKQSQATQVLDTNNDLIGKFYIYDRQSISYNDFPQHLIDALIATEDTRFYEHNGIDNTSLLRVFFIPYCFPINLREVEVPLPYNWPKTYMDEKITVF